MDNLKGVRVAILVEDGFEQVEMTGPRAALENAGAETRIVSPREERVRAWNSTDNPNHFEALLLPGGVMNPDALRINHLAVAFVKGFFDAYKPVAAMSRPLDHHRNRRSAWPADRLVAIA